MAAQECFKRYPERDAFYRIFYQTCRRFHVTWSAAFPEARAFAEEATRVAYEQDKARRNGAPLESVRSFFEEPACWCRQLDYYLTTFLSESFCCIHFHASTLFPSHSNQRVDLCAPHNSTRCIIVFCNVA